MSWTCHGADNASMVDALKGAGLYLSDRVGEAMKKVDRALFTEDPQRAYLDGPQPIGYQATISAPHMHAACLQLLADHLVPGSKALDVGSGSGYLTTAMALMVQPDGKAVGVEHIPELVKRSREAAQRVPSAAGLMKDGSLSFQTTDGMLGMPEHAPYDAIHVGAAAREIPKPLLDQLAPGGRMVVPVGPVGGRQLLKVIDRLEDGRLVHRNAMGVQYVPLTTREKQLGG